MGKSLYIGNLPETAGEASLRDRFEPYGEVASVRLITDRDTGMPRGFGYVEMKQKDAAEAARLALDGADFEGYTLSVLDAKQSGPHHDEGAH
jgi:RNA recognition motif-containing protein